MVNEKDSPRSGTPGVASENLRRAEENAGAGSLENSGDSIADVAESEEEAGGLFTGSGRDVDGGKGKGKGFFRRKGPMALVIGLIFGIGTISFFSVSTELVAWKENIYSLFGQNSAIISRRSNYVMYRLLSTNRSTTSNTIFGGSRFRINSKLQQKLSAQGIDYTETEVDGKKVRLLVYDDPDGKRIPIVASDSDLARANKLVGTEIDIGDGTKVRLTDRSMTLSEARRVNKNFDTSYDTATLTFTGKIAGWFDSAVNALYTRLIGKNARNQMDIEDPDEEKVNKKLLGNVSEGVDGDDVIVGGRKLSEYSLVEEVDENGKVNRYYVSGDQKLTVEEFDNLSKNGRINVTDGSAPADVENTKATLSARAKKAAMMSSSVGCAVLKAVGAISATIGAVQTINVINYASKYLELADKIKAGDADETVHIAANNLNESTKTTMYDIDGNPVIVEGSVTGGAGWNAPFSSTNIIDENDPSALAVNRELANTNALRRVGSNVLSDIPGLTNFVGAVAGFGASVVAFRACNAIQGVAGVVSFFADFATFFTFGISKLVKDVVKGAVQGAALAAAMITVGLVLNAVTPTIAQWFAGKLSDVFLGKTGGYALLSGAQNIMNSNLQMSTGRYANRQNAIEVFALTKDVEKEWAAYERATKSPFDVTSKYTFLGSIYNSLLPILNTSGDGVTSTISSVAKLASNSAIALISPSAMAANEAEEYAFSMASDGNCSYLQAVNVAGDFACNKYSGAYVDALSNEAMGPEEVYEWMERDGSFDGVDSEGNPIINVKSDYAKYIVSCVASDTQPGTMNGAVQGFITGIERDIYNKSAVASGLVNFGRNFVPFEGFLDTTESIEDERNIKWNSGLACTGNTNDDSFNKKVKYYSTYNLDQRVLYNMGNIQKNSTVSFLEDYYEKNPLDYSFEGQIARVSGLNKEEVEDTLALVEYYDYVTQYDASERYAFGAPVIEEKHDLMYDNENQVADNIYIILLNDIEFADVRNRNFVV